MATTFELLKYTHEHTITGVERGMDKLRDLVSCNVVCMSDLLVSLAPSRPNWPKHVQLWMDEESWLSALGCRQKDFCQTAVQPLLKKMDVDD